MKATIRQLVQCGGAIALLADADKVPMKAAYDLGKLTDAITSETRAFFKARDKVFEAAGCKMVGEPGRQRWEHEDARVFAKVSDEAETMMEEEVEINARPLDLAKFGDAATSKAGAFIGLTWAIREPPAEA